MRIKFHVRKLLFDRILQVDVPVCPPPIDKPCVNRWCSALYSRIFPNIYSIWKKTMEFGDNFTGIRDRGRTSHGVPSILRQPQHRKLAWHAVISRRDQCPKQQYSTRRRPGRWCRIKRIPNIEGRYIRIVSLFDRGNKAGQHNQGKEEPEKNLLTVFYTPGPRVSKARYDNGYGYEDVFG